MGDAFERLQALMGDTIQILDHMIVDQKHQTLLTSIKEQLHEQYRQSEQIAYLHGDERLDAAIAITKNLNEISQNVQQLENHLLMDYEESTGNNIEAYEQLAYAEQLEQEETYHDKIDYLSAVKIRKNLNRMNGILLSINP
jgi:hypothetical protein